MPSQEKFETCMRESAPSSKSLSGAVKWCEHGKGDCNKPQSCRPGNKYSFYMFSVLNADEILRGLPAEVKEMEPIGMLKRSDKVGVDEDLWNSEGIAKWAESSFWELADESQAPLLEQVVVVPNPVAFVSIPAAPGTSKTSVSSENVIYWGAAATFYSKLQEMIDTNIGAFSGLVSVIFSGSSSINTKTLVRDLYRDASPLVKLGSVFANQANCRFLINLVTAAMKLKGSSEFFVMMMCTDAYLDNVGLSAYSKVLEMAKMKVTPEDGIFFYEYEKNCRFVNEKPSYLCKKSMICPLDMPNREACLAPSLSEEDADMIFSLLKKLYQDLTGNIKDLYRFVDTCEIENHVIRPESLCKLVIEQLQKAGHAAIFSANPASDKVMAAYGWTDRAMASQMIPYFVNGTVAQVMNFENQGLPKDPVTQQFLGFKAWTNTEPDPSLFTQQQMASKFGHKGLSYYKSALGMDFSCAFSYQCMAQPSFLADGKTCIANQGGCAPTVVQGYDVGTVPGHFFGSSKYGTSDFHGIGKTKVLFVSDMFVPATFTQVQSDMNWGDIRVDVWHVSGVGMRTENCDASDPMDRGIDCSSPAGTINIGYNAIYGSGSDPTQKVLPIYSSYPHFTAVTPDSARLNSSYEPLSKVKIFPCESCPSDRDFLTYLYTEPETGTHVKGSQKIQVNMRFSANPAKITDLPSKNEPSLQPLGSVIIPSATDLVLPMYWIDKFDSAADHQKEQIAFVQSIPHLFNIVFWVALWVGILALALGSLVLWRGLSLRKAALSDTSIATLVDQKRLEAGDSESVATGNT